ncbi:S1C family serine protease [Treponema sp. C6A8]|uniref:S1C family serine protease n=1 Tax=Treponema sp. C6A8 TaxID=1410609 RepID=UPI0004840A47|nr:S1C family serine protease [Treponema sp. C6A8]
MKMKINVKYAFFAAGLLALTVFTSCRSLQQPDSVEEPIDYSNYDVVEAEIKRIRGFMEEEPVRALWRAELLGREDVKAECIEEVYKKFKVALVDKNYLLSEKYYKSLKSVGHTFTKIEEEKFQALYLESVPGLNGKNSKSPKTVSDCMHATVTIWVDRGIKVRNGAGYPDIIIGSGFFIDERGYLVTNHHVIESMVDSKYEGYSRLYVKLLSDPDTKIPAKVVGYDSVLDLALLKVEIEPDFVLSLGSSSDLSIGDKVSAIGTPIGLEGTITSGIISSAERKLQTIGNVFQIDAAVNSGNSGGPLIDQNMKVQAIVFAGMLQYQGLNFAVPVEYLKQILPFMYRPEPAKDEEKSDEAPSALEVIHPWICAYGHTMRNGSKKVGLEVQYVMPGGSAALAGLTAGDVITEIDGHKVTTLEEFQTYQISSQPGTMLSCKYKTKGSDGDEVEKSCLVYFEERPESPLTLIYKSDFIDNSFIPIYGMSVTRASSESKKIYKITKVIRGTVADEMSFSENDQLGVYGVKFDNENKYIMTQILIQRRKKGLIDVGMVLTAPYDNPYYF